MCVCFVFLHELDGSFVSGSLLQPFETVAFSQEINGLARAFCESVYLSDPTSIARGKEQKHVFGPGSERNLHFK